MRLVISEIALLKGVITGIYVTETTVEIYNCSGGVDGGYFTLANLNNGIGVSRGSFVGINGTIPMGVASATSAD